MLASTITIDSCARKCSSKIKCKSWWRLLPSLGVLTSQHAWSLLKEPSSLMPKLINMWISNPLTFFKWSVEQADPSSMIEEWQWFTARTQRKTSIGNFWMTHSPLNRAYFSKLPITSTRKLQEGKLAHPKSALNGSLGASSSGEFSRTPTSTMSKATKTASLKTS